MGVILWLGYNTMRNFNKEIDKLKQSHAKAIIPLTTKIHHVNRRPSNLNGSILPGSFEVPKPKIFTQKSITEQRMNQNYMW